MLFTKSTAYNRMVDLSKFVEVNYIRDDSKYSKYFMCSVPFLFALSCVLIDSIILSIIFILVGIYNVRYYTNPKNKFYWSDSELEKEINHYYISDYKIDKGHFDYNENGFYIQFETFKEYVLWDEIQAIYSNNLEFYYEPEFLEFFTEKINFRLNDDIKGYYIFNEKLNLQFSQISSNWEIEMKEKPFRLNRRLLYDRENLKQSDSFEIYYKKKDSTYRIK